METNRCLRTAVGRLTAALLAAAVLAGCATVRLVGDYDEQIDKGTTALHRAFETFLVRLESSAARPSDTVAAHAENRQFYADARVAISGLRLRADAMERNSLTVRAFDKLAANLAAFEGMHKAGITKAEIAGLIRPGFNAQFTAILTFELAKRRGERPDEAKAGAAPTPGLIEGGAAP